MLRIIYHKGPPTFRKWRNIYDLRFIDQTITITGVHQDSLCSFARQIPWSTDHFSTDMVVCWGPTLLFRANPTYHLHIVGYVVLWFSVLLMNLPLFFRCTTWKPPVTMPRDIRMEPGKYRNSCGRLGKPQNPENSPGCSCGYFLGNLIWYSRPCLKI